MASSALDVDTVLTVLMAMPGKQLVVGGDYLSYDPDDGVFRDGNGVPVVRPDQWVRDHEGGIRRLADAPPGPRPDDFGMGGLGF